MTKNIKNFFKGFVNATKGIFSGFSERNMKVHGLAAAVIIPASFYFKLNQAEWIVVLTLIGLVWAAELMNTALEELANIVRDELKLSYEATRRVRDCAAGAVWVLAIVAAIVGGMIFIPKFGLY